MPDDEVAMTVTAQPTVPPTAESDADIPDVPIYRLSVAQYHAMARAGILDEDAPVELLEGWLVQKMTKHPPHTLATLLVKRGIERLVTEQWFVNGQEPITLSDGEPEPDVFVVRGDPRDYRDRHPGPAEVALVVEVAGSSLQTDRGAKMRSYVRAGIPVYWIVNLKARQIEVYTDPHSAAKRPTYRQHRDYKPEDAIPVVLDGVEIGSLLVRELLP